MAQVKIDLKLGPVVAPVVVLIGPPGAGKTSIGLGLAEKLGVPFYDVDALIESGTGSSVSEIFRNYGEPSFRELESYVVDAITESLSPQTSATGIGTVVATGAGLAVQPGNWARLEKLGLIVFLSARVDSLVKRIEGTDDRPLLKEAAKTSGLSDKLEKLLEARLPVYAGAHRRLEVDELSISEAVSWVEQIVRESTLDSP